MPRNLRESLAFPGQELVVCGYGVNGTTLCFFEWGCYVDDGSVSYIDGAKSPKYIVSAADVDTYLGVEVQPMDDRDCREKVVTAALANDYKVTYEKKGKQDYPSLFFSFKVEYRLFQREKSQLNDLTVKYICFILARFSVYWFS